MNRQYATSRVRAYNGRSNRISVYRLPHSVTAFSLFIVIVNVRLFLPHPKIAQFFNPFCCQYGSNLRGKIALGI